MTSQTFDTTIIGAGPVGLILALGFAQQERKVCLVERQPFQKSESFDGRVLALTYGSMLMLDSLQIWQDLMPFVTPIEHVHVSQKGYLGLTKIHAVDMNVEALGYSITASDLGSVLWQAVAKSTYITLQSDSTLIHFSNSDENDMQGVAVELKTPQGKITQHCDLLVGADGTQSKVREICGIQAAKKSYGAFAVLAKIETEMHPKGWSYERFTTEGPVALLPMEGHFHKAVMVVPAEQKESVMALNSADYIELFADKMGERLGEFTSVSNRVCYPLIEYYADKMVAKNCLLIGNSSHTQHPVAAQGLNLGISDIQALLALSAGIANLNNANLLTNYEVDRKPEHERIMGFTDSLIQVFENGSPVVGHLRGLGLIAMEVMPKTRQKLATMAMGLKAK